jgi:hypothetical protein
MKSTEQERKATFLVGCSVEEWRRRGRAGLSADHVLCDTGDLNRTARMNGSDSEVGGGSTAAEMAAQAQQHLQNFIDAPGAENAHEHIARASAMCSAALSRCARENAERTSSMHAFRG